MTPSWSILYGPWGSFPFKHVNIFMNGVLLIMDENLNWIPKEFLDEMKKLLGSDYDAFLATYSEDHMKGLRSNNLKISPSEFEALAPYVNGKVSWTLNGFYTLEEQPAKHPYYYAGLYYIQEPSAMLPAALLPVNPGDKVLDLCAAPGGKTTELGAKLKGKGLLVSNDISASRAKALLKNIEMFGISNAIVISESPDRLSDRFEGYFDKILVDAPCSGEGMFRKVHAIAKNWEQYGSQYYADLQRQILPSAIKMLKPGGYMIFSTCTFSVKEDEQSLAFIMEKFPDMELVPAINFENERYTGFARGLTPYDEAVRIYPHKCKGEGHFVALLRKKDLETHDDRYILAEEESALTNGEYLDIDDKEKPAKNQYDKNVRKKYRNITDDAFDFFEKLGIRILAERLREKEGKVFLLPEDMPRVDGLRVLRTGLFLGEMKTGRFEPSQALALALNKDQYPNVLNLRIGDDRVIRYLKCESVELTESEADNGFCLVCVDGFPLGWAKVDKGRFKNKYLPSWRMM